MSQGVFVGRIIPFLLLGLWSGCASDPRGPRAEFSRASAGAAHYSVAVNPELSILRAKVCFDGEAPEALVPIVSDAKRFLLEAYGPEGERLPSEGKISLNGVSAGGCVRYVIDLMRASRGSRFALRQNRALLIAQTLWLWRPDPAPVDEPATIRFKLPSDYRVATAWPGQRGRFILDGSAFREQATVVIGAFRLETISLSDEESSNEKTSPSDPSAATTHSSPTSVAQLAILDGHVEAGREGVKRWISEAARAVSGIYGEFPVSRLLVAIVPIGEGFRPVAFGLVRRGGGASVMLLVHGNAKTEELVGDWTAIHEFVHLATPHLRRQDAWISEGIATYYQEVLRARADLQSPLQAWRNLDRGFTRGRRVATGRTLRQEARDMHRTGAYRRVYWEGTFFALELDVRLRTHRASSSLDRVIQENRKTFQSRPVVWKGTELLSSFEQIAGPRGFERLYEQQARGRDFPDPDPLFRRLGLVRNRDGELEFDDDAELAHVRDAIMSGLQ